MMQNLRSHQTLSLGLFVLLIGTSLAQQGFDCPGAWYQFRDKCYKFEPYPSELSNAETSCGTDSASLVSINSRDEHDFIVNHLQIHDPLRHQWFTSGRRNTEDATKFYWTGDGTEIAGVQFWLKDSDRSKPGNTIVYHSDGSQWGWTMQTDDAIRPYICEINRAEVYKIVQQNRGYDYGKKETDPSTLAKGPHFIQQPVDVIYNEAADEINKYIDMECIADAIPAPYYEWYVIRGQEAQQLLPMNDPRVTITNGRLTIREPKDARDNGNYYCVAGNEFGTIKSNQVQLSFGYLLDFPKSPRDPVRVEAFKGVGVECNPPKHYPDVVYSWYKDDIRNFVRPSLKEYIFISKNGKLYFSSATKDDEGDYYCLVFHPGSRVAKGEGKISLEIPLQVTEAIASVREPEIASGFPTVFPSSPKRGDNVSIECFAWGTDELDYSWSRVGADLPYNAILSDHNRVLSIPHISLDGAGEYRCSVTRRNGLSDSGSVQVSLDAMPYFDIPLRNQHIDDGADLTWRCKASGVPTVSYGWFRNTVPLDPNNLPLPMQGRVSINNNVLKITGVVEEDEGMYQCMASNLHGKRYSAGQLRVLSFAPTFSKYPLESKLYGTERGNLTIMCNPEAAPAATLTWFKDGSQLNIGSGPNDRVRILPNGNLHITSLNQGDKGMYTCKAHNGHGDAESTGQVIVLSQTVITHVPRNTVVQVNRTAFFHCEASYNPVLEMTYTWWHNTFPVEFIKIKTTGTNMIYIEKDPHYVRGTGINRGGLYIMNAQFYHAGEYVCEAHSTSERISRRALLTVVGPPGMPAGIYGMGVTSTSIVVYWVPGAENGRPITGYTIEGMNVDEQVWRVLKTNIRQQDIANLNTNVTGLTPFSVYKFRVRAENNLGIGEPSEESPSYTTRPAPPVKAVENVGGGGGKVGDLTITWDPLAKGELNGPGIGYTVYWKKVEMEEDQWERANVTAQKCCRYVHTVGADNFYLQYHVKVQPFNSVGYGPNSTVEIIYSAEDIPIGVATNIRALQYNSTALLVRFIPVENTREVVKGVLKGYRINYWKETGEDETMAIYNIIHGQTDEGLIIGLEPETYYYMNVQVFNTAGNGPKSQEFLEETLRSAPINQPTEVHVDVLGWDSINVKWRGVSTDQREEPLEGYKVRYWRNGESIYVAEDVDAMRKTRVRIDDLEQDVLYNLRVLGYSRGGDGLMSSPAIQFILGPNCRVTENSPEKQFVYLCTGCSVHSSILVFSVSLLLHFVKQWL